MKRSYLVVPGTIAGIFGVLALNPAGAGTIADLASATSSDSTSNTSTNASSNTSNTDGSRTALGDSVFVQYGNVQLQVTANGKKITDITAIELPQGDPRSIEISRQAAPMLLKQALTAQSGDISGISGATFTSYGYQKSLQSALDALGL